MMKYREFAKRLLPHIQSDDDTLGSVTGAIAEEPNHIKNARGMAARKAGTPDRLAIDC
jgi:hypothetical protein